MHKVIPRRQSIHDPDEDIPEHALARKFYCLAVASMLSTFMIMCISSFIFVAPTNELWWTMWQFMVMMDVLVDSVCILLANHLCKVWYSKLCGCLDTAVKTMICDRIPYAKLTNQDNI